MYTHHTLYHAPSFFYLFHEYGSQQHSANNQPLEHKYVGILPPSERVIRFELAERAALLL